MSGRVRHMVFRLPGLLSGEGRNQGKSGLSLSGGGATWICWWKGRISCWRTDLNARGRRRGAAQSGDDSGRMGSIRHSLVERRNGGHRQTKVSTPEELMTLALPHALVGALLPGLFPPVVAATKARLLVPEAGQNARRTR